MSLQNQRGVSLFEITLVMAIAVSLVVLAVKYYNGFQFQANEQRIAANVNQLFQALEGFYNANCRQAVDANSNPQSAGRLDPVVTDASGLASNILLSVTGDLVSPGFIPTASWRPDNPLLDNAILPNKGYYVQFNRVLSSGADPVMNVYACTGSNIPPSCNATSGAALTSTAKPSAQSRVIIWVAQVAVKLSPALTSAQWTQIKNDLNALCISKAAGTGVATCDSSPTASGYLVWTRTPTYYNPKITSTYWTATPYVRQFNMQYTNDGTAALNGITKETQNSTNLKNWYTPLNYLCGG